MKTFKKITFIGAIAIAMFALNACDDSSSNSDPNGTNTLDSSNSSGHSDPFDFDCHIYQKSNCDFKITDASWEISIAKYGHCSNITSGTADTIWVSKIYTPNETGYTLEDRWSITGFVFESNCRNSPQGVVYENKSDTLNVKRMCNPTTHSSEMIRPYEYEKVGITLESLYEEAQKECESANTEEDW